MTVHIQMFSPHMYICLM